MRIATAAALVAIAGSAEAAERHTWYYIDHDAMCQISKYTPDQMDRALGGEGIPPEAVTKDPAGNITVNITPMVEGKPKDLTFFSRRDCETMVKTLGLKPDHAPVEDVN